jgi:hypothetical protein
MFVQAPPLGAGFEERYDGAEGYSEDTTSAPSAYLAAVAAVGAARDEPPSPQPEREMPAAVIKILVTNNVAGGAWERALLPEPLRARFRLYSEPWEKSPLHLHGPRRSHREEGPND